MPRTARVAPGGQIYHVLNRGVGRMQLFDTAADYDAFLRCLADAMAKLPGIRLLGFCVMPNHWHLVLWPQRDGELARFMLRLTITHARRWLEFRGLGGTGHLYQGRYKSFLCESDGHLLTLMRYVERNAMRARLVARAEHWRWSSLHVPEPSESAAELVLTPWPITKPANWLAFVNEAQSAAELEAIRRSITSGRPLGSEAWMKRTADRTGWREPCRRGRPAKPNATMEQDG